MTVSRDRFPQDRKRDRDSSQAHARAVGHAEEVERVRGILRRRGRREGQPQARARRNGDDLVEQPDRDSLRLRPGPERDAALADDRLAAAGTQVGTIDASILASQISPTQPLPLKGVVQTDDPSKYAASATRCTGTATHEAVWLLRLQAAGTELAVPGYLDTVTDPAEANLGRLKLQFCLPSPYIPASAGGATLGAKLVSATLHLSNVFSLPTDNGSYPWILVATPYVVGSAVPNATGTTQALGIVLLPAQLTLKAKVKKRTATLSGALRLNFAGVAGTKVSLFSGSSRTRLKAAGSTTTRAGGAYSFRKTVRKTTYFRAQVSAPARSTTCTGGVPGIPCASATLNPFTVQSAIVRVKPRKR